MTGRADPLDDVAVLRLQRSISTRLRGAASTSETSPNETALVLAVIDQAIKDLWDPKLWMAAAAYLRRSPHPHAQLIGIEGAWLRRTVILAAEACGQHEVANRLRHGPPINPVRGKPATPATNIAPRGAKEAT